MSGFSGGAASAVVMRELLTSTRTYYVRTDGSDSNTGLVNSSGGAFLTIQRAIDVIATLDINGKNVTVQVGDGTYTGAVTLKNVAGFAGPGNLIIQGNNGTPANVLISVTSNNCFTADGVTTVWDIKDLKLQTTTSGHCLSQTNGAYVRFGNVNFGTCAGSHVFNNGRGAALALSAYAISGGATSHWVAYNFSQVSSALSTTAITITGTPAFTLFADCEGMSEMAVFFFTFTGSATGTRYLVSTNSVLNTGGQLTTWLPGNAVGSNTTGGLYV